MKLKFYLLIIVFTTQLSYAQRLNVKELKNWQLKGYAKSALRIGDIYTAVDCLEEYTKRNPQSYSCKYKLAGLYYKTKDYKMAKQLFEEVYHSNNKKYLNALFYYALILKSEKKYEVALEDLLEYRNKIAKNKRNLYNYLVNIEISGCEMALQDETNNNTLTVNHLNSSINKGHLESAPLIIDDSTMIYSSLNVDSIPLVSVNQENDIPVNKFYSAKLKNDQWQGENAAPEPFYNFDNQNTANGVFSLDKERFYFISAKRNWKNKMVGTMYVSQKKDGIWQKPYKLGHRINQKNYTTTQPAIGASYNNQYEVIYFISDRPGGWGGMDIWYTVYDKETGKYKKPINAGGYINTPADEVTPFYDINNKTLYFSSNGLPGYGGYDIFKAKGWLVNWTPAENAGKPLNSSFDDIYYCKLGNKTAGFVVSNREESIALKNPNCCFDIFEFSIVENRIDKKENQIVETKPDNIDIASSSFVNNFRNSINNTLVQKETINKEQKVKANKTTYYQKKEGNSIVLDNIYFEFNKSILTNKSKQLLDTTLIVVLKEFPSIVIEIGAHTDQIGQDFYNLRLSQLRAESVVNYLVGKGISKKRLIPVGYGENKPLLAETNLNGKDIPEAREKNRRIEFKVLGLLSFTE